MKLVPSSFSKFSWPPAMVMQPSKPLLLPSLPAKIQSFCRFIWFNSSLGRPVASLHLTVVVLLHLREDRKVHGYAKFRSERVRLHPMMRQVPRQRVHLHRQDRTDKYPDVVCTTTVADDRWHNYYHYDRCENVYFLYIAPNSFCLKTHASKV